MDRDEALKLLRGGQGGIRAWNDLRLQGGMIPSLQAADLSEAVLRGVDLRKAMLHGADLREADLSGADLSDADLSRAGLRGADLSRAGLRGADLREAGLSEAVLREADLGGADVTGATCGRTAFANVDLTQLRGLESIKHLGPSTIGVDTLLRSRGKIPGAFLRGCGLPDAWVVNLNDLIGAMEPIQFYSCFISYSTADEEFAGRLHNDFQAAGIRCWKWDHDARTGRSLWGEIDRAIRVHDKVVLVASESSLTSPAVNREIERAVLQEDVRAKEAVDADVLFPVALDDYLFKRWEHERKADVTRKVVADARGWDRDAKVYARVRDRLIRDLKAEDSQDSKSQRGAGS